MTLDQHAKLALFYYVIANNWVKMKRIVGPKADGRSFAAVIKACDEYRKVNCPGITFDELMKMIQDIHVVAKEQSEVFKTMNENFNPERIPLMDLAKFMDTIEDTQGIKAYVHYYKEFFVLLDETIDFMQNLENKGTLS